MRMRFISTYGYILSMSELSEQFLDTHYTRCRHADWLQCAIENTMEGVMHMSTFLFLGCHHSLEGFGGERLGSLDGQP